MGQPENPNLTPAPSPQAVQNKAPSEDPLNVCLSHLAQFYPAVPSQKRFYSASSADVVLLDLGTKGLDTGQP